MQLQHTFLTERFALGITDPNYVADNGALGLAPYDLTHGGRLFRFAGTHRCEGICLLHAGQHHVWAD